MCRVKKDERLTMSDENVSFVDSCGKYLVRMARLMSRSLTFDAHGMISDGKVSDASMPYS